MEAISSSSLQIQRFSETSWGIPCAKTSTNHCPLLRINWTTAKTPSLRCASRVSALAHDKSDEGSGEEASRINNDNGVLGFVPEETLSLSQVKQGKEKQSKGCLFLSILIIFISSVSSYSKFFFSLLGLDVDNWDTRLFLKVPYFGISILGL